MSTKPPPVPSKNALRVLRRLAFSSTTVLGAVGGVCGLATLNHEAWSRVKLAERVVATKTMLRSVSNGRGQAHVARMCEAAERGEDFTLNEKDARRRHHVRHQSTLAFDHRNGDEADVLALQHSIQRLSKRPDSQSSELQRSYPDKLRMASGMGDKHHSSEMQNPRSRPSRLPLLEYRHLSPESHNKFTTHHSPPSIVSTPFSPNQAMQGQRNSPSAEKILAATQMPLKKDINGVYARQTRQYVTKSPHLEASATGVRLSQAPALDSVDGVNDRPYHRFPDHSDSAYPLPDTNHRNLNHWTPSNRQQNNVGRTRPLSAFEAIPGIVPSNTTSNATVPGASPHCPPPAIGVSLLPGDEKAFSQWPEIPLLDEIFDDDCANVDEYEGNVSQKSVGPSPETERKSYFTELHAVLESSRSTSGADHKIIHLQASGVHDVASRDNKKFSSGALYAVMGKDGLVTTRVPISKMIGQARHQVRLLEKRTGIPTESDISQASEKLDFLLAQTDLTALRVSFDGISGKIRKPEVLKALTRCLDLRTRSSLIDAEIMYYAFRGGYIVDPIDRPCQRLISHLLMEEESYNRAASILFPDEPARTDHYKPSVQIPLKAASFYISWFCQQESDPNAWIDEVWKVISLAQRRGVSLHDRLIRPALKWLVLAQNRGLAQRLLNDVRTKTDMEITFLSYAVLVRSHAADGEWPSVQRILESLHSKGLPRTRSVGFSMLFQHALQEYLRQKSLNQAYDYLVDAISSCGLVPTSTISATIIVASLRQARYDLIQDWVEFVRQRFPAVDIGTGSAFSAWQIAQLWKERSSSCEEIESGCQAMAYAALRDPFSRAFRGVALGAVEKDLRRRMSITNDLWQYPSQLDLEQSLAKMNLKDIVSFVDEFSAKHPSSNALPLRQREHFKDLLLQLQAVTRLNALFGGEVPRQKIQNAQFPEGRNLKLSVTTTEEQNPAEAALEDRINSSEFPARSELWSMVSNVYVDGQRHGQKAGHGVLEYLIPRMIRMERMTDALLMLELMYESPYVRGSHGVPFTQALFSIWLYMAVELKNGQAVAKALWALVDSGIDLDSNLLLLVRIACDRKSSNKHLHGVERIEVTEECRYLLSKLQKRRWIRTGRQEEEDKPMFAEFRSWEERMRTRPCDLTR